MRRRGNLLPGTLLSVALFCALGLVVGVVFLATERPWLGLRLVYDAERGAVVVKEARGPSAAIPAGTGLLEIAGAGGARMRFEARDLIPETDGVLETYAVYDAFIARQERLAAIQDSAVVTFTDEAGREWVVEPGDSRPITDLPAEFWVALAVGVIAWLIAAGVWVFRRGETSAWYLLLSGWSTAVFSPMAAIYTTRELALPGPLFRLLSDLNFMGGSIFAGTMVALLLCYPRQVGPKWIGVGAVLAQLGWFAAQQVDVFESMILARRVLVMAYVAATFGLAWWQWRLTRLDPVGRAALRWFLLSWVVVSGVFALLILLPQMFGFDTTGVQAYSFLMFVLVYVGLGFGILRYRLFGLDEWWARIMTWMAAVALLVVLDLLFLLQMHLSSGMSLSLSLLICGLLWLPLRGFVTGRLLGRAGGDNRNAFKAVVDVALAPNPEDREALWRQCLRGRFDPLRVESVEWAGEAAQEPVLDEVGQSLSMPEVGDLGALRLEYARGGRALFTRRDLEAAKELTGMLRHVIESRRAFEKGVKVERVRIARDIHDSIGAQLLSALHSREEGRREEVLRGALADLRGIINDASNPDLSVAEALGDLRYETSGRLAAGGVELDWQVEEAAAGGAGMSVRVLQTLRALVREAASNILKHAKAKKVRVAMRREAGEWVVMIEDDGAGFDGAAVRRGNGLANMESRAAELGGTVAWSAGDGGAGARVMFRFPAQPQA